VVVTSDTQAPSVTITAPSLGATLSSATTLTATASDNTSVVGVQFKVDGANIGAEDTTSPYSITWDSATVANGSHTLTAVARDPAGNSATSTSVPITVNNTTGPMLLGDQTVESSADSNSSGEAEAFSYTAVATGTAGTASFYVNSGSAATSLKVGIYSNNNGHPGTLLTSGTLASPKAAAWNLVSLSPGASLSSGTTYWIGFLGTGGSLNYKDQSAGFCSESYATAGQTNLPTTWSSGQSWPSCAASAYVSATLATDNIPPTVSVTAPIDGSTVSGNTTITANASDNVGVTKVEWYLDGSLQSSTTSSPYSFTWNTRNASNGSHQITSKSYDAAGNMGTSTAVTVTVSNDLTAPTVPTGLSVTSTGMTQTQLSWNASTDDTAVTGYHIWRNGTQVATVTATSYTDSNLNSGTTYNYSISAFDAEGNESVQSATVSATTGSDTISPTSPTNLAQTGSTASTATVSWSASTDNVGVAGYDYYNGGMLPLGSTENTNVTFTGLSCGTSYTVGIDAFDAAGNHSSQSTTTVATAACDTIPPTVNISTPADGSTVSGTVAISASASDNVGIAGVQFKFDGANLGSEVTTSPYSVNFTWRIRLRGFRG
jgi:chitodextrinase